jgi:hypothetical protein
LSRQARQPVLAERGSRLSFSLKNPPGPFIMTSVIDFFALMKGLRSDDLDFSLLILHWRHRFLHPLLLTSLRPHFPFLGLYRWVFVNFFPREEEMYGDKGDFYA